MPGMQKLLQNPKNPIFKNGQVYVTYGFNDPDYGGNHYGADLQAGRGVSDYVVAIDSGVVEYVKTTVKNTVSSAKSADALGNNIKIKHADETTSRYCHLKHGSVCVTVGQAVKRGDVIGFMGTTGYSFGEHVHFEIWDKNNKKIDPLPFILGGNNAVKTMVVASKNGLNIRTHPTTQKPSISILSYGQKIEIVSEKTVSACGYQWIEIKSGNVTGWCAKQFLK